MSRGGRSARRWLAAALPVLLLAATRLAGAAEAEHGEHHGTDWKTLGIAAVNFAALLFLLKRYAGPLLQNFFFQRSEAIRKQLEQAQTRLRTAETELAALRQRLARLDDEAARSLAQQRAQADAERERSAARVAQTAQRIREEAQRVAERELARARTALREEAAALATGLAAELLREKLAGADHQRLIDEFVEQVEVTVS